MNQKEIIMYIIASKYSNDRDGVGDTATIYPIVFHDINAAVQKAKQLFVDDQDNDRDADSMVVVNTGDVTEFDGAPVVFGIGEYEDDDYELYHLIYAVIEVNEQKA